MFTAICSLDVKVEIGAIVTKIKAISRLHFAVLRALLRDTIAPVKISESVSLISLIVFCDVKAVSVPGQVRKEFESR